MSDRDRALERFADACYSMFDVGYDRETLQEELERVADDWVDDYGTEPPRKGGDFPVSGQEKEQQRWMIHLRVDLDGDPVVEVVSVKDLLSPEAIERGIGFDCAHLGDLSPGHAAVFGDGVFSDGEYRTLDYVRTEVASLASRLVAAVPYAEPPASAGKDEA